MIEFQGTVPAWIVYTVGAASAVYLVITFASVSLAVYRIYLERQLRKMQD